MDDTFAPEVKQLLIYPNPANEQVTLELEEAATATVRIFDANGRVVRNVITNNGLRIVVNTADLQAGMYYVEALQGNDRYIQKLIID